MAKHSLSLVAPAHPWKRTARTVFAVAVPLCLIAPAAYEAATQQDAAQATGLAATILAVAAAITRVLALPQVEAFLRRFLPWLSASDVPREDVVAAIGRSRHDVAIVAGDAHLADTGTPVTLPVVIENF